MHIKWIERDDEVNAEGNRKGKKETARRIPKEYEWAKENAALGIKCTFEQLGFQMVLLCSMMGYLGH